MYIVMEICNNVDLATYLYENDGKLEEARIRDVVHQRKRYGPPQSKIS